MRDHRRPQAAAPADRGVGEGIRAGRYRKTDFSLRDSWDSLAYPGFWWLARKHLDEGWMEMRRSFSKKLFVQSLQRLLPEVQERDVTPAHAGVRVQALNPDGGLVDDFLIIAGSKSMHCLQCSVAGRDRLS